MATLVLTAVGTALGGPIGGAIGAFVGRQADQAVFGGGTREGPRLRELSVTTSSYGQPLPRHFGKMRVAGTVIWSTELIETSSKQGGGKGRPSVKTYSYAASFAVALSSTPIDRIGRIWADGNLLRGTDGDLKAPGTMRFYSGTGDHPIDPIIAADRGELTPAFRDCAYVVFEDLQLGDFGNRIPALTFEVFANGSDTVSLGQIVPNSPITGEGDPVLNAKGFSDEGGPLSSSLSVIDRVYPLLCTAEPAGLRIETTRQIPANIPTLPEPLANTQNRDASEAFGQRGMTKGREPLALRYYDPDRDYQPSVQRALGVRPNGREAIVDLPATLTASGARVLANSNAHRTHWRDETMTWRIGEIDPAISPGKIVRLPSENGLWRVDSWEWFDEGVELSLKRVAPELGLVAPGDAGAANTPVDTKATPTLLRAIEVPQSDDSQAGQPLMFAAVSSSSDGWRGASLMAEQGGTLKPIGTSTSRRAIFGQLVAPLAPSGSAVLEPAASLEIVMEMSDLGFASTDMTGLAMGENKLMVGAELVQFAHAERVSDAQWRLSGLLRGRAGTEDTAILGHPVGTDAILIDDALIELGPGDVPSQYSTRIAAVGLADPQPVFAPLKNSGLSQKPPVPVAPCKHEFLAGGTQYTWTRRARGQWRWAQSMAVPLVEEKERYLIGYGPCDSPFMAWNASEPRFFLSAEERAVLSSGFGAADLWVRQTGTYSQSSALLLDTIN